MPVSIMAAREPRALDVPHIVTVIGRVYVEPGDEEPEVPANPTTGQTWPRGAS